MPEIASALNRGRKGIERAVKALVEAARVSASRQSRARSYGPPGIEEEPIESRVLAIINRPQGASSGEVAKVLKISQPWACTTIKRMEAAGIVERYMATNSLRSLIWYAKGKAPAKKPQGFSLPKKVTGSKPTGEVIVPATVKRTIGPGVSYDPRFQLPPDTKVKGGFVDMGIGRYL